MWKIAQISAIPKPGKDTTLPAVYRPISLPPVISKIFETILVDRLESSISACNVIPNHQFGFRKAHSKIQQVHRVTNKNLSDFDNKKFCIGIFLDIEKAFHKVWHTGLLYKLICILPQNYYHHIKI